MNPREPESWGGAWCGEVSGRHAACNSKVIDPTAFGFSASVVTEDVFYREELRSRSIMDASGKRVTMLVVGC